MSTKTLRFYERRDLLPTPSRLPNGYPDYGRAAVARVAFVRQAQQAGFTLAQIREILAIRDGGQPPCVHVDALIHQRLEQTERRIAELTSREAASMASQRTAATARSRADPPAPSRSNGKHQSVFHGFYSFEHSAMQAL